MAENSKIEWTDHTFNPWWGCTAVSPACDHCYAESFAKRVGFSDTGSQFAIWGKDAERRSFGDKHWSEPAKWDRDAAKQGVRKRVFCGSMCDVMEEYNGSGYLVKETLDESRQWLYNRIERTLNLDWLLLTKRPQNFRRFLPAHWLNDPRPNVWGMTTLESKAYLWRVDALRDTPFAVRGLSIEPLLEDLGTLDLTGIHWVIVGGESGHGARPMHPDWARSLRDQCKAAGVPFLFKQWGEWTPENTPGKWQMIRLTDAGENGSDLGANGGNDVWMRKVGKHKAGRILDGCTWDELPRVEVHTRG